MRVLGIDCGTERTGFGVIDTDGKRHVLVEYGTIRTNARHAFPTRLIKIATELRDVVDRNRPNSAAVEAVFHSANTVTALKLAHVRGVALLTLAERGIVIGEYSPMEVKKSVVGWGKAEKHQVQGMVQSLLKLDERIGSEDAADALAVAICHATHSLGLIGRVVGA
jgi:crossover junction endodeoxyribonuclease RuvC